ncbi:hypothetical protein OO013_19725 [Mangrovivirga sp. M17]|uniref:Uncharacterized protein n=1 Tax=Mangrovivirga halotolerans TaxID=2993936 RepID=A0ABT3RWS9_9BACT|nr:hypothetical protein [Mangrovivirga halotolerans]MCX2746118.1 hypothetical protein [Mangrovivirga halotolerans]
MAKQNSKSKKYFLIFSAIFILIIGIVCIDIARRTTFPGGKPQLKERIFQKDGESPDSSKVSDTIKKAN